jgi:hypothetical protein
MKRIHAVTLKLLSDFSKIFARLLQFQNASQQPIKI